MLIKPYQLDDLARLSLLDGVILGWQCVTGDTIVHSPDGDKRIDSLAFKGKPVRVYSLLHGKSKVCWATPPWVTGFGPVFRVTMKSGREITANTSHRFLSERGWVQVSSLSAGERLLVSDVSRLRSTVEHGRLIRAEDDLRFPEIAQDSPGRYFACSYPYDERPRFRSSNGQAFAPLLVDALRRNLCYGRTDGLGTEQSRSHRRRDIDHLSTMDSMLPLETRSCPDLAARAAVHNEQQYCTRGQAFSRSRYSGHLRLPIHALGQFAPLRMSAENVFHGSYFDKISSIAYVGQGYFYDLHVPAAHNYLTNGIWSHNCGLGKTVAMFIWAMLKCGWDNRGKVMAPVLIISQEDLHAQTIEEGRKFFGIDSQQIRDVTGRPPPGFYIASYTWLGEGIPPDAFDCVMVDEGDRAKKTSSDTGRMVRRLKPKYRLIATATPMADRLPDLFWLCSWVCENDPAEKRRFPYHPAASELSDFAQRFICQSDRQRSTEVSQLLLLWRWLPAIILRRRMDDTGENVVGMEHRIIPCPLSTSQKFEYQKALFDPAADIGVKLGALRRVAGGAGWPNPKLMMALELIASIIGRGQQVLVASDFRGPNDSLSERLQDAEIPHVVMDGRTHPAVRAEMADRFRAGEIPIALIGLKSGAEGQSYPACNNVILLNYSWELKKLPQVIHRARRINSARDLEVWSLISEGTIENRMAQLVVDEKSVAADLVLDGIWPKRSSQTEDWMAIAREEWQSNRLTVDEAELESQWPGLRARLRATLARTSNSRHSGRVIRIPRPQLA